MFLETLYSNTTTHWSAVILPTQRIFVLYLLSAFVLAVGSYIWFKAREEDRRPAAVAKGMFGYIFDRDVWLHRSARQDYIFFFVNGLIYYGIISQLLLAGHVLYGVFLAGMEGTFGAIETPVFEATPMTAILYTLVVVLLADFAVFLTHYLQHKLSVLWEFHKVHHSAEVMTPITVYRMHPVDLFFTGLVAVILVAMALAGFVFLTGKVPSESTVLGVNVILFVFYLVGYNLRHSHIWLSYPPWVSYILISPAQHQTHHSIDEKHYDRNFGLVFAFWDWAFGTLYVPRGYERLTYGVSREEPNPFGSVTQIYLKPFRNAWEIIAPAAEGRRRKIVMATSLGLACFGYVIAQQGLRPVVADSAAPPSLMVEELTWTEIARAQADGFDTIIVPTGGTEQNGPHVILGKHNHVVRETSTRIARALGRTLVAPVLPYVPEGDWGPEKTGHMQWPGTVSLPEPAFEAVLEAAARSYRAHGFSTVILIGDSGWNQDAQDAVARRLSAEWEAEGARVLHIGDYYAANGQIDWLKAQGFSEAEIGGHAGIRDTSELLAVFPEGVRPLVVAPPEGMDAGYSGAPAEATAEIGETMLRLKVDAALREIERLGITPKGERPGAAEAMGASALN